jgi:DNA-binding transcriptional LysR family regulator
VIEMKSVELPSPLYLKTFRKAFELRNFTATAKTLGMTQSGVSQHVALLEETIGAPLFERIGRGLVPTKIGEIIYQFGGSWLSQMEEMIHDIREGEKYLKGRIVVGTPGGYGVVLLRTLVAWQKQNPELIIEMEYGPNSTMARELGSGRMDVAITSASLDARLFACEEFFQQEYILVSHPDLKPRFDSLSNFLANPFIDYVGSENIIQRWLAAHFKDAKSPNPPLNIRARINNMESIFYLLEQRIGVTIFPIEPLAELLAAKRLKMHKTSKTVLNPLYICQRRGQHSPFRVQALREIILAQRD